jgi:4-amino-4-deoxy-L-arabinose transferase-like glycosyltransferase
VANKLLRALLVAGFVVWLGNAVLHCSTAPLGHDEARYATDTQELLAGHGKRYLYVPVGMNVIAAPGVLAGGDERALRALSLVAGILFLTSAWLLARRAANDATAAWVVAVLAGALPMIRFSSDLLSDLPSAACLLSAIAILVTELGRPEGPRYRLVAVAPLCAASFYIRYGSSVTIAAIGLGAVVMGARAIVRRPLPVILTVVVLGGLVLPHVVYSIEKTGKVLGILLMSAGVPGHPGEGLPEYLTRNPLVMYGPLIAPLMVVGLVPLKRDRITIGLQVIAVAQIVGLGLTTYAQPRFVFLAATLLVIVGVDTIRRAVLAASPKVRVWLVAVCIAAVVALWARCLYDSLYARSGRFMANAPAVLAGRVIRSDAHGADCTVIGHRTSQLNWYSGCRPELFVPTEIVARGGLVYAVLEPGLTRTDAEVETAPVARCLVFAVPGVLEVLRLAPASTRCLRVGP